MKDAISTFIVDSIIEYEGDRKRLSTLFFKVRWLGYNTQLHQFLRENGLGALVPMEHRGNEALVPRIRKIRDPTTAPVKRRRRKAT